QLATRNQIVDRVASAVRVAETAPAQAVSDILNALTSSNERFWIDDKSALALRAMDARETELARELDAKTGGSDRSVSIQFRELPGATDTNSPLLAFSVAVRLANSTWLHYERSRIEPLRWWRDLPFSILVSTIPVLIAVALFVGWITRPVRALAKAAEQV